MNLLKNCLIGVVALILVFVIVGLFLPSEFRVQRSVTINAPAEDIYANVVDLKKWQLWGVWFTRDPDMVLSYSGPDRAIGMKSQWQSETEGNGEMEIIGLEHNGKVVYSLYFPDFDMGSTGEVILEDQDGAILVTWVDYGDVGFNPVNRYFAVMMDSMVGPDFETGLENLKTLVESSNN